MKSILSEEQVHFGSASIPERLGQIASNLARTRTFFNNAYEKGALGVIAQTKDFIEWTAPVIEPEQAEDLVNIQIQLALWEITWNDIWSNPTLRAEVAIQADVWSQRVLNMSGLLESKT